MCPIVRLASLACSVCEAPTPNLTLHRLTRPYAPPCGDGRAGMNDACALRYTFIDYADMLCMAIVIVLWILLHLWAVYHINRMKATLRNFATAASPLMSPPVRQDDSSASRRVHELKSLPLPAATVASPLIPPPVRQDDSSASGSVHELKSLPLPASAPPAAAPSRSAPLPPVQPLDLLTGRQSQIELDLRTDRQSQTKLGLLSGRQLKTEPDLLSGRQSQQTEYRA